MKTGSSAGNTAIEYVYRDGDGYELKGRCIVRGPATSLQIAEIRSCLDGDDRFIPEQVDIPGERPPDFLPGDTCWFHLSCCRKTSEKATLPINIGDLVTKFRKAKGKWAEDIYTALAIEGSRSY